MAEWLRTLIFSALSHGCGFEPSQILLVGGQVVFLGDLTFLPHLTIDSAQNEWNNLDRLLNQNKKLKELIGVYTVCHTVSIMVKGHHSSFMIITATFFRHLIFSDFHGIICLRDWYGLHRLQWWSLCCFLFGLFDLLFYGHVFLDLWHL